MDGDTTGPLEPSVFICPITHAMFRDPVFVPESGNTYERNAIQTHWSAQRKRRDPLTNVLCAGSLHTNWGLRREVQSFLDEHVNYVPAGWEDRNLPPIETAKAAANATQRGKGCRRIAFWTLSLLFSMAVLVEHLRAESAFYWPILETSDVGGVPLKVPKGSRLEAWKVKGRLVIQIPAPGIQGSMVCQLMFSVLWLSFVCYWTFTAWNTGVRLFVAFSLPFWAVGLMLFFSTMLTPSLSQTLTASPLEYQVKSQVLRLGISRFAAKVTDLEEVPGLICMSDAECRLILQDGVQEIAFGGDLKPVEVRWIQKQLCSHWGLDVSECLANAQKPRHADGEDDSTSDHW